MSTILVGKKSICSFVERSWPTVYAWIRTKRFPARKIDGVWESDTELIINWRRNQIIETHEKPCQE